MVASQSSIVINNNVPRVSSTDGNSIPSEARSNITLSRTSSSESSTIEKEVDQIEHSMSASGIVLISSSKKRVAQKRKSHNPKKARR